MLIQDRPPHIPTATTAWATASAPTCFQVCTPSLYSHSQFPKVLLLLDKTLYFMSCICCQTTRREKKIVMLTTSYYQIHCGQCIQHYCTSSGHMDNADSKSRESGVAETQSVISCWIIQLWMLPWALLHTTLCDTLSYSHSLCVYARCGKVCQLKEEITHPILLIPLRCIHSCTHSIIHWFYVRVLM